MVTTSSEPATLPRESYLNSEQGLKSWLLTQDHKRIALLYLFTTTFFFVIGGVAASLIRLELLTPAGDLVASAGGANLDRGDAIEIADLLGEGDAGRDRGLGRDMGRIGFQATLVDPKRDTAPAEGADIHVHRPRDQLKEAEPSFEDWCWAGEPGWGGRGAPPSASWVTRRGGSTGSGERGGRGPRGGRFRPRG